MLRAGRLARAGLGAGLAAFAVAGTASAQEIADRAMPGFRVFRRDDGVPQSTVKAMTLDAAGRLWIGTQAGPAFYDGKGFTALPLPEDAATTIVRAVAATADGAVWFGTTEGGVYRFTQGSGFTHFGRDEGLPSPRVNALLARARGELWAGTEAGLARLSGGRFVPVELGGPTDAVWSLAEGNAPRGESGIWVGTAHGVARCEDATPPRCTRIADPEAPTSPVEALLEVPGDGGSTLWAGARAGLARLHDGRWEAFAGKLPHPRVDALADTLDGSGRHTLWIGTYGGGLVRMKNGVLTTVSAATSGLPSNYVQSLVASGPSLGARTLWVGTDGGGVARLRHDGFRSFTAQSAPLSSGGYVEAIAESAGSLGGTDVWLAPADGLLRSTPHGWTPVDLAAAGAPGAFATCFARSRRDPGVLWAGLSNGAVGRVVGDHVTLVRPDSPAFERMIHVMREAADGRGLWVGTANGAARVVDGAWSALDLGTASQKRDVFALLETGDPHGGATSLWVGTSGGLVRVSRGERTTFGAHNSPLRGAEVIALASIRAPSGARVMWIGSIGGGVVRYDLDADRFLAPLDERTAAALPDRSFSQIHADARGRVYLFTNRGVARLTPRAPSPDDSAEFSVYTFTTEDGLPADECTGSGGFVDAGGRVWAGTTGGAAVFDPADEVPDTTAKPLAPLLALAGDAPLRPGEALRWDRTAVSFEYALLTSFRERDTRYRTRLVGFDAAAGPWTTDGKARYTNLQPGDYTFQVWGRDYAGNVSGPSEIAFSVRTAPWKTGWAALGYAAVALGLVYGAVRARLARLAEQNRLLEERVLERTHQLDRKNDELGQKNAALDAKVLELDRKNGELEASNRRADRIFTALADALPGTELDGKYRLETCIGQGAFGAVFRARHLALARDVAVKIFRPTPGNDSASALARFQREGASASRVSHPNAVQVFDAGVSREGIAYLVMELLEGRSLAEELRASGPLPLARAAGVVMAVCAALEAAHARSILHRDIKPDNVFLHRGPNGEVVKVVDFGIAKLVGLDDGEGAARETRGVVGTVAYMSPERFQGGEDDARTDVYAVGVTAYEMLSGVLPYPPAQRTLLEQVMRQLADPPAPLAQVAPAVPSDVARVIMACLSADPSQRPTLRELSETLRIAAGLPEASVASAPSLLRPSTRSARSQDPQPAGVDALGRTVDTSPDALEGSPTIAAAMQAPSSSAASAREVAETLEVPVAPPREPDPR
jgi:serine/threonine protein kinase/ligand-binding sensor domain-containing protein